MDEEDVKIVGYDPLPNSGAWDVKIAFYRPAQRVPAYVQGIMLRLSTTLTPETSKWEVRVYKVSQATARLLKSEPIQVDPYSRELQHIPLSNKLLVDEGQNVALVNTAGSLKVHEKKLEMDANGGDKIWWSMNEPPAEIGSTMTLKSSANPFRLGWSAVMDVLDFKLGRQPFPSTGAWTIRAAFYKTPVPLVGCVTHIALRLSQTLTEENSAWEARIYSVSRYQATLLSKRPFEVDVTTLDEQSVRLCPSLPVEPGQFVAIVNTKGPLVIREQQQPDGPSENQIYWTDAEPPSELNSVMPLKRSEAPYHLGWSATISPCDYFHGYPRCTDYGSWDIRAAYYSTPCPIMGYINAVELHLTSALTADRSEWEVRTYSMAGHRATLRGKQAIQIDHTLTTGQRVRVVPPLVVMEGQHVALVNLKGPLKIRQKKLEASRGESGAKIWWSAAVPSPAIGSDFMMKRSEARYRLGWSALISKFVTCPRLPYTAALPEGRVAPASRSLFSAPLPGEAGAFDDARGAGARAAAAATSGQAAVPAAAAPAAAAGMAATGMYMGSTAGAAGQLNLNDDAVRAVLAQLVQASGAGQGGGALAGLVGPAATAAAAGPRAQHARIGSGVDARGDDSDVRRWLATTSLQPSVVCSIAEKLVEDGFDTMDALRTLEDEDLKELGVRKGHRRVIIQAVNELRHAPSGAAASASRAHAHAPPSAASAFPVSAPASASAPVPSIAASAAPDDTEHAVASAAAAAEASGSLAAGHQSDEEDATGADADEAQHGSAPGASMAPASVGETEDAAGEDVDRHMAVDGGEEMRSDADVAAGDAADDELPEGDLQLFIQVLKGAPIHVKFRLEDTVAILKRRIARETGVPPAAQVLIYAGRKMTDEHQLKDLNVQGGSTVHLVPKSGAA